MIGEQECVKILNSGEVKLSLEEVKSVLSLMTSLATIEYEDFIQQDSKFSQENGLGNQLTEEAA